MLLNELLEKLSAGRWVGWVGFKGATIACDARLVSCVARFCGRPGKRTLTVPDAAAAVCQ